jgi:hypothetical protein
MLPPSAVQSERPTIIENDRTSRISLSHRRHQRLQHARYQHDPLRFQRPPDTRQQRRPSGLQQRLHRGLTDAGIDWAFQRICQQEPTPLKFRQNCLPGLSTRSHTRSCERMLCFAPKGAALRIQKLTVIMRRIRPKQHCSNVERAVSCRPFQSLQPPGNMLGRSPSAAPITL